MEIPIYREDHGSRVVCLRSPQDASIDNATVQKVATNLVAFAELLRNLDKLKSEKEKEKKVTAQLQTSETKYRGLQQQINMTAADLVTEDQSLSQG
eukprot:COSAG06_NODE_25728_length_630_cov_0.564972_1_plen_95_part_10